MPCARKRAAPCAAAAALRRVRAKSEHARAAARDTLRRCYVTSLFRHYVTLTLFCRFLRLFAAASLLAIIYAIDFLFFAYIRLMLRDMFILFYFL